MQNLKNPALAKLEANTMSKLNPQQKQLYVQVVKSGMAALYDPSMRNQMFAGMHGDKVDVKAGIVVVGLIKALLDKAKWQKFDPIALKAGAIGILVNLLDFLEQLGTLKVTPQSLQRAVMMVKRVWPQGTTPPGGGQQPAPQAQQAQQPPAQGLIAGAMR